MPASTGPPAGWYEDPADAGRLRWWDGQRWTAHVSLGGLVLPRPIPLGAADDVPSTQAAWHPDPVAPRRLRWWDGAVWTDQVATGGHVERSPLPRDEAALAATQDERATWPAWVAGAGLAIGLASAVLALGAVVLGDAVGLEGDATGIALASTALYSGLLAGCWWIHRRCATGRDFRTDFALRYRRGDWWRGLVGSFLARVAVFAVVFVLVLFVDDPTAVEVAVFDESELTLGLVVAFGITALVLAPIVEEVYFRGLLMRSLETVLPVWAAILAQAALFGLAHTTANLGTGDLVIVASTAAAGAVFGLLVRRYRRLGPAIAAHAWFNLVAFLALVALTAD